MTPLLKKLGYATLVALLGIYAILMMTGPRGLAALLDHRGRIEALQEANADRARENTQRRERIRLLQEDRDAQELEILKRLNKKRPGTQPFYINDADDSLSTTP